MIARVNNVDDPQFVRRDTASLLPPHGFGMAVRQTLLGLRTNVSDVAGGTFRGVVDIDFYGGQQPSSGGRTFPLLRIRTAHGTLHWTHGEIMAGQEIPLFSPQNPISPAAFGTPDFVGAGNLWLWLPQVRVTGEVGSTVRLALQGAVLAPTSGDAVDRIRHRLRRRRAFATSVSRVASAAPVGRGSDADERDRLRGAPRLGERSGRAARDARLDAHQ